MHKRLRGACLMLAALSVAACAGAGLEARRRAEQVSAEGDGIFVRFPRQFVHEAFDGEHIVVGADDGFRNPVDLQIRHGYLPDSTPAYRCQPRVSKSSNSWKL